MPELPDLVVYTDALRRYLVNRRLQRVIVLSPFVLRSVDPPLESVHDHTIRDIDRVGKRIVFGFDNPSTSSGLSRPSTGSGRPEALEGRAQSRDNELFLVVHLMIAGRLKWVATGARPSPRTILAAFEFEHGTLLFTEVSSKKRALMQLVRGEAGVRALDPGGLEPLVSTAEEFHAALTQENHTVKRALTDPRVFSGIGNAYSDEILHAARLSPLKLTGSLSDAEHHRLYHATRTTLTAWVERLRQQTGTGFPEKVTAFRPEMAVHGRFKQPCPVCGAPVQRIVYAENECNYCARCQTGGRRLADRSLSRLLRGDWPRSIDES